VRAATAYLLGNGQGELNMNAEAGEIPTNGDNEIQMIFSARCKMISLLACRLLRIDIRRSASLHFLHHNIVVCQHQDVQVDDLVVPSEDEIGQRHIQFGDAIRKAALVLEKASYDPSGFPSIHLHGSLHLQRSSCLTRI
jgi:hypothetical protein